MFQIIKQGFSVTKKIILVLAVFIFAISLFMYFLNKDKVNLAVKIDPIVKNREEIYKFINDKKLNSTPSGKIALQIYKFSMCTMLGEACTNNPADADKNFSKSSVGFISKLITLPIMNPPASGLAWAYDGLQSAGFIPKTYAAEGIGFAALKPYANLWKMFRDLSYLVLVIILIAIGFMIMFRMKINPQTVISVENALPKIVIALILVTFSFAIAGFLIDLMYILIAIGISILSGNNTYYDAGKTTNEFITSGMGTLFKWVVNKPEPVQIGNALLLLAGSTVNTTIRFLFGIASIWLFPPALTFIGDSFQKVLKIDQIQAVGTSISGLLQAVGAPVISFITFILGFLLFTFFLPQLIIGALIWFTLIYLFFRLFFYLFSSYFKIILLIIFSPIILLFEAIPGKSVFTYWIKTLFAEILNFPMVIILILVGFNIQSQIAAGNAGWAPPFLGGIDPNVYSILLGMAIILMIPEIMKLIREIMGVKDMPIGFGIGTFFSGAAAAGGGALAGVGQFGSLSLGINAIAPLLGLKGQNLAAIMKEVGGKMKTSAPPSSRGQGGALQESMGE